MFVLSDLPHWVLVNVLRSAKRFFWNFMCFSIASCVMCRCRNETLPEPVPKMDSYNCLLIIIVMFVINRPALTYHDGNSNPAYDVCSRGASADPK